MLEKVVRYLRLKTLLNAALNPLGLQLSLIRGPDASRSEDWRLRQDWKAERLYWHKKISDFYKSHYGVDLHPIQSDDFIVAPLDVVTAIQGITKANRDCFFATGYCTSLAYQEELLDHHFDLRRMERLLEFGVGLGRLIIHYYPFKAELHGCDVTKAALEFARAKLGQRVKLELSQLEPKLDYPDQYFDYIYANSVFTHIPRSSVENWIAELYRIVRPGGCVISSAYDPNVYFADKSLREFDEKFESIGGGCELKTDRGVLMTTYMSRVALKAAWSRYFEVLELRPHFHDQWHIIVKRQS